MEWETVIGLEVHAQLATTSKLFSGASTAFGAEPNTQACAIDLGFPGVLPVLNEEVVNMAIKLGLGINAEIPKKSVFSRKNYFYPDLPKGYQISQFEYPVVGKGHININLEDGTTKRINITRAHLEEDAGKSLHEDFHDLTGVDLNRAGTPLLEIVSEPDMRSAKEAVLYLKSLHSLVRYLEICDGNMQEGSFRCDANVSVRKKGESKLGTRTELKNINSFRYVEKAINYEVERQISIIEDGGLITQETRLYNPDKNETKPMRSKEEANDYRYFPDPDLLTLEITNEMIDSVKKILPELPQQKLQRFIDQYSLSSYDAAILISSSTLGNFYEIAVKNSNNQSKLTANWVNGELAASLNKNNLEIDKSPVTAKQIGELVTRISDNTISSKIAKTVFEALWNKEGSVDEIIEKKGLKQVTDHSAIENLVDKILRDNLKQLNEYKSGKDKLFGFFVGQAMKASGGKINPKVLNDLLKKKLAE
ncbi:Asp-tRNA(Asn)/Glu-tRNA(Gln) amidotransferase subunit GatB [Gammaproteobacteria bacterium]|nr:Asp-tRNA(Asn)/Glu-tRNA(Gln) amidotransferase subunit GatB [Gammaproteobacteria bacterium]